MKRVSSFSKQVILWFALCTIVSGQQASLGAAKRDVVVQPGTSIGPFSVTSADYPTKLGAPVGRYSVYQRSYNGHHYQEIVHFTAGVKAVADFVMFQVDERLPVKTSIAELPQIRHICSRSCSLDLLTDESGRVRLALLPSFSESGITVLLDGDSGTRDKDVVSLNSLVSWIYIGYMQNSTIVKNSRIQKLQDWQP